MKKFLLATTAVVGLVAAAQPAAAQLEVTLGGYNLFQMGYFDDDREDLGVSTTDGDFRNEAGLIVEVEGVADNGLEYGAFIEAVTSGISLETEIAYVYLQGPWGHVRGGEDTSVADHLGVSAPTVGFGQIGGDWYEWTGFQPHLVALNQDEDYSTKATYLTPRVNFEGSLNTDTGVQAGITYVPEWGDTGFSVISQDSSAPSAIEDVVSLALHYADEYEGVGFEIGGSYTTGDSRTAAIEEIDAWGIGASATYAGFTVGGGYLDNDDSATTSGNEYSEWNAGVTYEQGPWGVGLSAVFAEVETTADDYEAQAYGLGGVYEVAPGLTVSSDVIFFDIDQPASGFLYGSNVTANPGEGFAWLAEVGLRF